MNRYEILMLATPAITGDEASTIEKGLEGIIKKGKGEVISFERWGKCRLAYPVKKHDYGIYYLTRFESPTDKGLFGNIKTAFAVKYNDVIMRHVVVRLQPGESLEYNRPHTVEDIPTRDVDSFLRENKMEGLLSTNSDKKVTAETAIVEAAAPSEVKTEEVVAKEAVIEPLETLDTVADARIEDKKEATETDSDTEGVV